MNRYVSRARCSIEPRLPFPLQLFRYEAGLLTYLTYWVMMLCSSSDAGIPRSGSPDLGFIR